MDFSRDVNDITQFIKDTEAEVKEHRKRDEAARESEPRAQARVKEVLSDLQTQIKVWLNHVSAASRYAFEHKVVSVSEISFDILLGTERVSVTAISAAKIEIEDHTTQIATAIVVPNPFFQGVTPMLVDALKRQLMRQIRAALWPAGVRPAPTP